MKNQINIKMNNKNDHGQNIPEKSLWFYFFILFVVIFSFYANTLNNPFVGDDIQKIVLNPDIKEFPNWEKLIYPYGNEYNIIRNDPSRPITSLTFAFNYMISNLNVRSYHIFNILLHSFISFGIFKLGLIIFKKLNILITPTIMLISVMFFALNPVMSYSVNYIYCRSDLLCALFYIFSVIAYCKFRESSKGLAISTILFILSIFSKQSGITLPFVLIIYELFINSEGANDIKRAIKQTLPFWLVAAIYLLWRQVYFGGIGDLEALGRYDPVMYTTMQPLVWLKYILLILLPLSRYTSFRHEVLPFEITNIKFIIPLIFYLLLVSILIYLWKSKKGNYKIYLFSAAFFFSNLLPTSSVISTITPMVENRIYMAAIPLCLLIGMFLNRYRKKAMFLYVIFIFSISFTLLQRNVLFASPIQLWKDTIKKYPNDFVAHIYLSEVYLNEKDYKNAIMEYNKSLIIKPNNYIVSLELGNIYNQIQDYNKAIETYKKGIIYNANNSKLYKAIVNTYLKLNKPKDAIQYCEKLLSIQPNNQEALKIIIGIYIRMLDYKNAIQYQKELLKLNPKQLFNYYLLGNLYYEFKDFKNASKYLKQFVNSFKANSIEIDIYYNEALQKINSIEKIKP